MSKAIIRTLRVAGVGAVLAVLIVHAAEGAKERVYTMGDDDPGAMIGGTPPLSTEFSPSRPVTNDIQESTTDFGTSDAMGQVNLSLVPLLAPANANLQPHYVDASDRPGALPGNLALSFDGGDIMYNVRPPTPGTYMAFDPRNFGGGFATLSQAWVKPAATNREQFVFRAGNEIGGAMITSDDGVTGYWTLRTGNPSAEVMLEDVQVASNVEVVAGAWTHVAVLRGGNQSLLYVNGQLAAVDDGFWSVENVAPVVGSADPISGGSFFEGVIDNFSVGTPDGFDPELELDYFVDSNITFSGVAGDINQDGNVDQADYEIWSMNVGFDNGLGFGDPGTLLMGDADQTGQINLRDFQIINAAAVAMASQPAGSLTAAPEPSTIVILATTLVLFALRGLRWASIAVRQRWIVVLVAAAGYLASSDTARSEVVVAEDFSYDGPTKLLHVGGGFSPQVYRGGQNGPAGNWAASWGQVGDGIITTPDYTPPIDPFDGMPEPVAEPYVALHDGFFGVQSELLRAFALDESVSPTQTLYFGGRFRIDLEIGTDGGTVPQFYAPRLFLNRVAGDDRKFDINGVEIETQRDRSQDIGVGIQVDQNTQESFVIARLGADENNWALEATTPITTAPPDDGEWHSVIGKLELNVGGGPVGDYNDNGTVDAADYVAWRANLGGDGAALVNRKPDITGPIGTDDYTAWRERFGQSSGDRLTVWFDPTGQETGGTMVQLEAEVLPNLDSLLGVLRTQGSVPTEEYVAEPELGRSYLDDIAIGTAWEDVADVDVPRLTLRINTDDGNGTIVNDTSTSFDLDGYSIESPSGSLDGDGWFSLAEQGVGDWEQNLASESQLVETFFLGSTALAPGGELPLGKLFSVGEMQDVVGRFSTADTLLNLFMIEFVSGANGAAAGASAVPEPSSFGLLVVTAIAGMVVAQSVRTKTP